MQHSRAKRKNSSVSPCREGTFFCIFQKERRLAHGVRQEVFLPRKPPCTTCSVRPYQKKFRNISGPVFPMITDSNFFFHNIIFSCAPTLPRDSVNRPRHPCRGDRQTPPEQIGESLPRKAARHPEPAASGKRYRRYGNARQQISHACQTQRRLHRLFRQEAR